MRDAHRGNDEADSFVLWARLSFAPKLKACDSELLTYLEVRVRLKPCVCLLVGHARMLSPDSAQRQVAQWMDEGARRALSRPCSAASTTKANLGNEVRLGLGASIEDGHYEGTLNPPEGFYLAKEPLPPLGSKGSSSRHSFQGAALERPLTKRG